MSKRKHVIHYVNIIAKYKISECYLKIPYVFMLANLLMMMWVLTNFCILSIQGILILYVNEN